MVGGLGLGLGISAARGSAGPGPPIAGISGLTYQTASNLGAQSQNSDGTGAAAVDGPVGRILDTGGNGFHFIQATAAARPILRQAGSLSYWENDGVDDILAVSTGLPLLTSTYLAVAARRAAIPGATFNVFSISGSSTNSHSIQTVTTGRAAGATRGANATPAVVLAQALNSNWPVDIDLVISSLTVPGTTDCRTISTSLGTDDVSAANAWTGATPAATATQINLFGVNGAPNTAVTRIYAFAALRRAPTSGERTIIETWLAAQAGFVA